jgi:hypothetical protein
MTLVKIDLSKFHNKELGWKAQMGVDLSHWCRKQGYHLGSDYEWSFRHDIDELHFSFKDPALASFFALKWTQFK